MEHNDAISRGDTTNALAKHHILAHQNRPPDFSLDIIKGNIQFNLDRFLTEALVIEDAERDPSTQVMNQKSEWGRAKLTRADFSQV